MKMKLDVHKYEQYVEVCEALNVKPLTFEEIYENVDDIVIVDHINEIDKQSKALGNAGQFIAGGLNKLWSNPGVQKGIKDAATNFGRTGMSYLRAMSFGAGANAVIDTLVDVGNDMFSGGGNNGNFGGQGGEGYNGRSPNSLVNNLQFKGMPLELKLDTGILNRVWTNTILTGTTEFSPMHMTSINMSLENLFTNGDVQEYFQKAFYMKLLTLAQSKVNFSVSTLTAFKQENISGYISALMDGLNAYFFYTSVLNYFENPQNNNYAMTDLRHAITPDIMNELVILQRQLTSCPVPPKLMNFLYYLNGNFKANHLDGSAIIKFETVDFTAEEISNATTKIKSFEQTASLLSRIFPEWLYQDLPVYPGTCFHDWTFNTIWTNAPYTVTLGENVESGPFTHYPDDLSIAYQTFTSELDGAVFALTSLYRGTEFIPGLIKPKKSSLITENSNRVSFGPTGWVNSANSTNDALDRMDTYPACAIHTSTLLEPSVKSMCEPVRSVNLITLRQAHFDFIDFIASFDKTSMVESSIKDNAKPSMKEKAKPRRRRK